MEVVPKPAPVLEQPLFFVTIPHQTRTAHQMAMRISAEQFKWSADHTDNEQLTINNE
jgi:hypothetical protein